MRFSTLSALLGLGKSPTGFHRSTTLMLERVGTTVYAASSVNKQCVGGNICYSMNVPDATTSSGGDVFFQISGPTSYSWIAMGTGSSMSGSNMFVIYTSSSGQNVTLSLRKSSGHNTPSATTDIKAELLGGSGVTNGVMTANIKCTNSTCPLSLKPS